MDREIEFRGKSECENEWLYGSLVKEEDTYFIFGGISEHIKRDDFEVYMTEVQEETIRTIYRKRR